MNVLLLNQTFYPDTVATAQYLADLAKALLERGHAVTVITGRTAYDDPSKRFPNQENWQGIRIIRVFSPNLGKTSKWRRAVTFASFMAAAALRLLFQSRCDVVVALTSPPLISFLAAVISRLRRVPFIYWVMDLNPDEAVAAGWLKEGSVIHTILERFSRFSLNTASRVIVLDRFMQDRIRRKGVPLERIHVVPPWGQDEWVSFDPEGRARFRKRHALTDKFVVMYSGNHSPCHSLSTMMESAKALRGLVGIHFCFVGGGSEWKKIRDWSITEGLQNVSCLPYQPLPELAGSLSSADLHVVSMGNQFVGLIHPCKIYNILATGCAFLYLGPRESHVGDLQEQLNNHPGSIHVDHGDVSQMVREIQRVAAVQTTLPITSLQSFGKVFSSHRLLPMMGEIIESSAVS